MGSFSIWHWLIVLGFIAIIFLVVRTAARRAAAAGPEGPTGVGGWLVLPIIGFTGTAILTLGSLAEAFAEIEGIKAILSGATEEAKLFRIPVLLSLIFGLAVVISASICLYKIAISRRSLRKIAVLHYAILAVAGLIDLWAESSMRGIVASIPKDPEIATQAVRGVIAALIWIPYFLMSRRVANTFEKDASTLPEQVTS